MKNYHLIYSLIFAAVMLTACSVGKYIPDGKYYLKDVYVTSDSDKLVKIYSLKDYVQQSPNSNWFGAKVPLGIYKLSGTKDSTWYCKFFRKLGEAPVIYDSLKHEKYAADMVHALANAGYIHAEAQQVMHVKNKKLSLEYRIHPKEQYYIRNIDRIVEDPEVGLIICGSDTANSLLVNGMPFNINTLNDERNRITAFLRSNGYYKFTKEDIKFEADTMPGQTFVDITVKVKLHMENGRSLPELHKQYVIGKIDYKIDATSKSLDIDTVTYKNQTFYYYDGKRLRPKLLSSNTLFAENTLYNDKLVKRTYQNFLRLGAISFSNIELKDRIGSDTLDCVVSIKHAKPNSIGLDVEATNSAGDLGAALSASFQQKNIFKGSETFTFKLRGAYEAITGLEGYDGHNYWEFGAEARISFPHLIAPGVKRTWGTIHKGSSEISLQYNMQDRPEFNRRVLTGVWRYRWNNKDQRISHRFDLLEINYVHMPWISKTFKEQYLDSLGKTNAILKYNYEDLLITKLGYNYTYNSLGSKEQTYGKNAYTIKFNFETSGNLLQGMTNLWGKNRNEEGQNTFMGIAFAQYVKGDFEYAKSWKIDKNNSVAIHAAIGIAYPYGNSKVLPFEKRYFAGGANSVRGWSVRSLGPGSYNGQDKGINFINQSGDIKLDFSLEYRAFLFWKINGALFLDAGNIWTIRKYEDQPGGEFRFDKFYEQIAAAYGLGLRMNLDFFVLRFDAGMKAINPAYEGRDHYPIYHPKFKRDFAFHFSVGLPF